MLIPPYAYRESFMPQHNPPHNTKVECTFSYRAAYNYQDDINGSYNVEVQRLITSHNDPNKTQVIKMLKAYHYYATLSDWYNTSFVFEPVWCQGWIQEEPNEKAKYYDISHPVLLFEFIKDACAKLQVPLHDLSPIYKSIELPSPHDDILELAGAFNVTNSIYQNIEDARWVRSKNKYSRMFLSFYGFFSNSDKKWTYEHNQQHLHDVLVEIDMLPGTIKFSDNSMLMVLYAKQGPRVYELESLDDLREVYNLMHSYWKKTPDNHAPANIKKPATRKITDNSSDFPITIHGHAEDGICFTKDYALYATAKSNPNTLQGFCVIPEYFSGEVLTKRKVDFGASKIQNGKQTYTALDLTSFKQIVRDKSDKTSITPKVLRMTDPECNISCIAGGMVFTLLRCPTDKCDDDDDDVVESWIDYKFRMECPSMDAEDHEQIRTNLASRLNIIANDIEAFAADKVEVYGLYSTVIFVMKDGTPKIYNLYDSVERVQNFINEALQLLGFERVAPQQQVVPCYTPSTAHVTNRTPLLGSPNVLQFSRSSTVMPEDSTEQKEEPKRGLFACLGC